MIDTHSHLYSAKFDKDRAAVHERTKESLSHVFLPNIDMDSIPAMNTLADSDPELYYPMMGLHPCSVKEAYKTVLDNMEQAFGERKYYGVGETGLDYHWDTTFVSEQKASLRRHVEWAKDMDLPLILHTRKAMDDVIEICEEGQDGRLKGIFHCFNGDPEQAKKIMDLGFYMGIGGVLTYKKAGVDAVVKDLPLESLVLETDSPYLPPTPHRGKRNESSYTLIIARKLADLKETTIPEVDKITSNNALTLFGLKHH